MRDLKRIKQIVKLLEKVWKKFPEFRLGQLLENVATAEGQTGHCVFYTEDDEWVKFFREYAPDVPNASTTVSPSIMRKLRKLERLLDGNSKVGKRKKPSRKGKTTRTKTR